MHLFYFLRCSVFFIDKRMIMQIVFLYLTLNNNHRLSYDTQRYYTSMLITNTCNYLSNNNLTQTSNWHPCSSHTNFQHQWQLAIASLSLHLLLRLFYWWEKGHANGLSMSNAWQLSSPIIWNSHLLYFSVDDQHLQSPIDQ